MIAAVKDIDSAVAVPLTVSGAGAGVLLVMRFNDASPFTREEVAHVEYFAQHAALALGFARAREDRERLAVLADRERIARDLHDLVIQRLFATGLGLAGLSRLVAEPELRTRLAGYLQELDHTVLELRTSIFAMRDTAPTRASLRAELWDLTRHAVDTLGFHPRVTFDGPIDFAVSNPHWDDILAVAREALANVARHAEATSATVDLAVDRHGRQLMLTITDDGVGVAEFPGRSSGLRNLAERAARWGGSVDVGRAEPRGTRMEWTIPLSDEPRQAEEGRP